MRFIPERNICFWVSQPRFPKCCLLVSDSVSERASYPEQSVPVPPGVRPPPDWNPLTWFELYVRSNWNRLIPREDWKCLTLFTVVLHLFFKKFQMPVQISTQIQNWDTKSALLNLCGSVSVALVFASLGWSLRQLGKFRTTQTTCLPNWLIIQIPSAPYNPNILVQDIEKQFRFVTKKNSGHFQMRVEADRRFTNWNTTTFTISCQFRVSSENIAHLSKGNLQQNQYVQEICQV